MQGAPVLGNGQMEAKLQNDIILNNGGGFNISPHLRLGLVDHYLDVDTWVGTGKTDFQLGALGKYNILPDLEGQVALSMLAGFAVIRDEKKSYFLTSFGFVTSKDSDFGFAKAVPYAALQVEALVGNGNSIAAFTLVAGNRWEFPNMKWKFYSELDMNLRQSVWSLCFGAGHPF